MFLQRECCCIWLSGLGFQDLCLQGTKFFDIFQHLKPSFLLCGRFWEPVISVAGSAIENAPRMSSDARTHKQMHATSNFIYKIVNSNHVNKFHSCVPISSKSFTITHVVNFIQDETQTYGPIPSMSKLITKWQFQPYGPISFMWSSSSKWIIHAVKKNHGFHPSHLIFISHLIPYWHQCHACGKTQFPVKFIQYPLSRKWSV